MSIMRGSLLLLVVTCLCAMFTQIAGEIPHPLEDTDEKDGCGKQFLFFEFTTEAPVAQVKASFKDVILIFLFKVVGAGRYLSVVKNDQSEALKNLSLPDDACLSVSTFPIETFKTFFGHFGIDFPASFDRLNDEPLIFVEAIFSSEGLNEDQFAAILALQANLFRPIPGIPRIGFAAVSRLPTKYLFFISKPDCDVADGFLGNTNQLGGPGNLETRVLKLHKI